MSGPGIQPAAFVTLLCVALMFSGNHVAARFAFDHGVDVPTAVAVRSLVTAACVGLLVWLQGVRWTMTPRQARSMPLIGVLLALQSLCLYAAVARIPVALALLAFNTFPMWTALCAWAVTKRRPPRAVLLATPVILVGLALALDVLGAFSGLGAQAQWSRIGTGVAFAVAAAVSFGMALVATQQLSAEVDGRVRSAVTMAIVGALALTATLVLGGPQWPTAPAGWWGLAGLTVLYGTAFTIMFTLLPRLGVVGSSPILNVEPVFALALAWTLLGQAIAPVQVVGALVVVGAVVGLGLRR